MPLGDENTARRTFESSITETSKAALEFTAEQRIHYFVAAGLISRDAGRKAMEKIASKREAAGGKHRPKARPADASPADGGE